MDNFKAEQEVEESRLVFSVIAVELILLFLAFAWASAIKLSLISLVHLNLVDIIASVIFSIFFMIFNFICVNGLPKISNIFKGLKTAYEEVVPLAANISYPGAFVVALFSSVAEEFFFRGVVQYQLGIIVASVIFGLFHIGSRKTLWYGVYAVFAGFYMGFIYIKTGNILVPILVHFFNNFFALPYMKHYYRKRMKSLNN